MRLWMLYLRSRFVFPGLATMLLLAGGFWAVGYRWTLVPDMVLAAVVMVPLAAAVVICATTTSPFGDLERTLSRPLWDLRFAQLAGLLLIASLALAASATALDGSAIEWRFVRNLLGLTGMGLLTARLLGGRLAWTLPVMFAVVSLFQVDRNVRGWAWTIRTGSDTVAILAAAALLLAGLAVYTRFGARDTDGSTIV